MKRHSQPSISTIFTPSNKQTRQRVESIDNAGPASSTTNDTTSEEDALKINADESGDKSIVSLNEWPDCWNREQYLDFKIKYDWLCTSNGYLGCTCCRDVKHLNVLSSQGVSLSKKWVNCAIDSFGKNVKHKQHSLRKKIFDHKSSAAHTSAQQILSQAESKSMENLINDMSNADVETCGKVFRTAYHIAKNDRPFVEHPDLIDLQVANGVHMGRVLQSNVVCNDIIKHISKQMKQTLITSIQQSKSKISILIDESTTASNKTALIIYLRAFIITSVENTSPQLFTFFLDLVELENQSAGTIYDAVIGCLNSYGFSLEMLKTTLVGFASDGASVMLGHRSGVAARLKTVFTDIVIWHCLNHRLELAIGDALTSVGGGINHFQCFMTTLYSLYSQSPKNCTNLQMCASALEVELKKIGRILGVRWVASSYRCVHAVLVSFPALVEHFKSQFANDNASNNTEKSKFKGLHKKITSKNFIFTLCLMHDLLLELKTLSELLQERNCTISKANRFLINYIKRIESFKKVPGEKEKEATLSMKQGKFRGVSLTSDGKFPSVDRCQLIQAVVDNMNQRLLYKNDRNASFIKDVEVVMAETVTTDEDEDVRYGETELKNLAARLGINTSHACQGYIEFKMTGRRIVPKKLQELFNAVHTLPVSTADCERGFSKMNIIISDLRNKLHINTVSHLMFISLIGPPVSKFKPEKYVKTWLLAGRRSALATDCMQRQKKKESDAYKPLWDLF